MPEPPRIEIKFYGLNPEDLGAVSIEKLRTTLDELLAEITPGDLGAIALDQIGIAKGIAFLDEEAKVPSHLLPDKLLTWDRFNAFGGVPQIAPSFPHTIPGWTIPIEIYQRLSALENKTSNL
jgi:hypothetical protein